MFRAYPGSEFVVADTLAKWRKLEPNEIDFSQGFSQKEDLKKYQEVVLYLTLCQLHVMTTLVIC